MKTTESTKTTVKNTPAEETKVNAETKDKDPSVKISVKNLKKTFGKLQVLKDINIPEISDNEILVKYPEKVKAVTPGQACVLYLGEQCLGSGIIKTVMKK